MRIFVLLLSLFFPFLVFAQGILINEIAWMGTPVAGVEENQWWRYEWLELSNVTDQPVALGGWTIELSREKLDFLIPLKGEISSRGYFLVGASEKILPLRGISRRETIDLNYKNLGGKFFNGGQKVVLKNSLGEIIDEVDPHYLNLSVGVDATAGWPAGNNKTKQTMERRAGSDSASVWQTSREPGGTPKAPNSEGMVVEIKSSKSLSLNANSSGNKEIVDKTKLSETKDETEKDPLGRSDSDESSDSKRSSSFQSRVPVVNPITLLAGVLALGFSGVLLLVKRSLVLRQKRQRV